MGRLAAMCSLLVLLLSFGCARQVTPVAAPPKVLNPLSQTRGVEGAYLRARQDYLGKPATLTVTLWAQRSVPTASGESSIAITAHVSSSPTFVLTVTGPELRVFAVTARGTVPLENDDFQPRGRPFGVFGGNLWGSFVVALPPQSTALVIKANVGRDLASAKTGVEMRVPLAAIPTTGTVQQYDPAPHPAF